MRLKKEVGLNLAKPSKTDVLIVLTVVLTGVYSVYLYAISHSRKALLFFAILVVLLVGIWLLYRFAFFRIKEIVPRVIFPVSLTVLAVTSALFFPAGSIPDEPYHFFRSYELSNLISGQDVHSVRVEDSPLFSLGEGMSTEICDEAWDRTGEHVVDGAESGLLSVYDINTADQKALHDPDYLSDYLPQQKLPSAIGISLAKAFGLNYVSLFYFGRIFNAIYGIALIVVAVRLTPVGKNAMMVASVLPMTVHLLGSYSYDVGTMGLAFLATALILRLVMGKNALTKKDVIPSLAVLFLLAPCKVVYSCVAILLFLIDRKRFTSRKSQILYWLSIVVVILVPLLVVKLPSLLGLVSGGTGDSPDYYTLASIVGDPLSSAAMFMRTLEIFGWSWLMTMVGGSLGWFQANVAFPNYVSVGLLAILLLSSLKSIDDEREVFCSARFAAVLGFCVCAFCVIMSMWTGWTAPTEQIIQGVQGRYFIPLLPLLLIAFRPKGIMAEYRLGFPLLAVTSSVTIMGFAYISAACAAL